MTQFYSRVDTTLNGDVYGIPFSYTKEEEIHVYINNEIFTNWYFLNESQIKLNEIPADIPNDAIISIRRVTDISEKAVDYTNNTMLAEEALNLSQDQLLYAVQEVYDNNIQFEIDTIQTIKDNQEEIIDTLEENRQEILDIQDTYEQENNAKFEAYQDELNTKFETVSEAAEKVNALEEAVNTAVEAATTASEQANIASEQASIALEQANIALEQTQDIFNTGEQIKTDLNTQLEEIITDITEETNKQIENIQDVGFYMRDDKLYFINSKGEEEEFKSGGSGFDLFDTKISDHILEGEEAKGWALQGTYVTKESYPDFYQKCLEEKNNAAATETTLADGALTMFVNDNGHQFFNIADKSIVDTFYNTFGIADFYGIDEENERIFLPRNKYFQQLTDDISKVNEMMEAGLPNIEAIFNQYRFPLSGGAITYAGGVRADSVNGGSSVFNQYKTTFNASLSNPIYGNSDTVQPPSSLKLLYYCVGNTEVTQAITNVTEVTTSENDTVPLFTGMYFDFKPNNVSWLKAGKQQNGGGVYKTCYDELVKAVNGTNPYDLKVINNTHMVNGINYDEYWILDQDNLTFRTPLLKGDENLPSNKYQEMELKTSGETYIAPANGWFSLNRTTTSTNQFVVLTNMTSGASTSSVYPITATSANVHIECKKGDVVKVLYTAGTANSFGFIYAQGNGSLYFKVANAVQNLELLDAGEVLEAVNEINSNALTRNNKEEITSWGMPDYKNSISVTLPYVAPCDGVMWISAPVGTNKYFGVSIFIEEKEADTLIVNTNSGSSYGSNNALVPKGATLKAGYGSGGSVKFIPLKGAN